MKKPLKIFLQAVPILFMLGLIYTISDDYLLTALFLIIIAAMLIIKYEKLDFTALVLGTTIMTCGELLFIGSGIETFSRTSLFGVMPLWLPVLWGYCFVAIKRAVNILRVCRV